MLTIDLLRHGSLEGGVRYRGSVDDPLTMQGRIAMDNVWQHIGDDVTAIVSSPLSRCAVPAQAWAKQKGVVCDLDSRIQELHYGAWEGLTAADIKQLYPGLLEKWRDNPDGMTPPHGEPMQAFFKRTHAFLHGMTQDYENHEHVLVVAHSGTIRMLIAHALQAPVVSTRHLAMPYACWSRLYIDAGKISLAFHAR